MNNDRPSPQNSDSSPKSYRVENFQHHHRRSAIDSRIFIQAHQPPNKVIISTRQRHPQHDEAFASLPSTSLTAYSAPQIRPFNSKHQSAQKQQSTLYQLPTHNFKEHSTQLQIEISGPNEKRIDSCGQKQRSLRVGEHCDCVSQANKRKVDQDSEDNIVGKNCAQRKRREFARRVISQKVQKTTRINDPSPDTLHLDLSKLELGNGHKRYCSDQISCTDPLPNSLLLIGSNFHPDNQQSSRKEFSCAEHSTITPSCSSTFDRDHKDRSKEDHRKNWIIQSTSQEDNSDRENITLHETFRRFSQAINLKSNFLDRLTSKDSEDKDPLIEFEDSKGFEKELDRLRKDYWRRVGRPSTSLDSTNSFQIYAGQRNKPTCGEAFCNQRMRRWAFWFIVTFLAILTIKDVYKLVGEYLEYPKKADMNIGFNESMTMPNITFCMSRAQAWSHFRLNPNETKEKYDAIIQKELMNMTDRESFLHKSWDYRMVMETYHLIESLTSMERETKAHGTVNSIFKLQNNEKLAEIRRLIRFWLSALKERKVTFEEFVQKVGKETLKRSMQRFQRVSYNEDEVIKTDMRITWVSQWQLCFQPTFDAANYKMIDDQGNFFIMQLLHNVEKLESQYVDCMSVDFHGRPSSSTRFMGAKGVMKDGFNDEHCMGMFHETTVEVKANYKMLPNDEPGKACANHEPGGDNEYDCYLRCRLEFVKDLCKCIAPTLSYLVDADELAKTPICDYSNCEVDVQGRNYSDEDCSKKCLRDCDQIRYHVIHETKGKSARSDFTTIKLNWGSFEYLTLRQDWVYTTSSFIAAIGGSIGMWLGLSILSLIQGSTYMYAYVADNVIKKGKQQSYTGSSSIDPTDPQFNGAYIKEGKRQSTARSDHGALSKLAAERLAANPLASPFKRHSVIPNRIDE